MTMPADEVRTWADEALGRLCGLGARAIVLTGLPHGDEIGVAGAAGNDRFFFSHPRVSAGYPGTGDLFASVLLGRLLAVGRLDAATLRAAAGDAALFTGRAIARTLAAGTPVREGVLFEDLLGGLSAAAQPCPGEYFPKSCRENAKIPGEICE